jgi:mono/diheme cytochrome c family protein
MNRSRQPRLGAVLLAIASLAGACSSTPLGAPPKTLAAARARTPEGAALYERECSGCHGSRGEGLSSAPSVMGPSALPTFARGDSRMDSLELPNGVEREGLETPSEPTRPAFRTAEDLYAYVSKWMPLPQERIGCLEPEEYWAVVNYLLIANGSPVPANGVNAGNASTVPVH